MRIGSTAEWTSRWRRKGWKFRLPRRVPPPTRPRRDRAPAAFARQPSRWLSTLPARPWFWLLAGASLAIGFVLLPYLRVRHWLGKRLPVQDEGALRILQRLEPRQRLRLTVSKRIMGPVTLGILRPEICLPQRGLEDLDATLLRAMLAHELAHLERRDPLGSRFRMPSVGCCGFNRC